jgi:hypothetical protein
MVFPSRVEYVTYDEGLLPGDSQVEVISKNYSNRFIKFVQEDVLNNKFEYRIVQNTNKKSFLYLKNAAKSDSDFAFVRYSFGGLELWDREIVINKKWHNVAKKMNADFNEGKRVITHNSIEKSKEWIAEKLDKTYEPKYHEYIKDDFRGMLIEFKTIPDFDKRKDDDVCGY